jgi:hypothetical protein
MARKAARKRPKPQPPGNKVFELKSNSGRVTESEVHVYGNKVICDTEPRGHATPRGRSPLEIVVDASEGFIPLWARGTTLRWQFRELSLRRFKNPTATKNAIRQLFGEALLAWGDAAPVKFSERSDAWDFEIVVRRSNDCDNSGCVLASAFFPDAGRHQLLIYPKMFEYPHQEQVETLIHEIGHAFGLRHFFAKVSEKSFASEIFGVHKAFTIMNYGSKSKLTPDDRSDLKKLYQLAWSGELTEINGTPIRFVKPFHSIGTPARDLMAVAQVRPPVLVPNVAYPTVVG